MKITPVIKYKDIINCILGGFFFIDYHHIILFNSYGRAIDYMDDKIFFIVFLVEWLATIVLTISLNNLKFVFVQLYIIYLPMKIINVVVNS